jgi:transcriptional regulator with XRE-family HTH domain
MAEKGARARLEPIAARMYAEGQTLDAIAEALGVSRQSLSDWKARTRRPSEELDEWDRAREQKQSIGRRLKNLLERELEFAEKPENVGKLPPQTLDGISKLGALVKSFETAEREAVLKSTAQRAALFLDFVRDLIEYGGRNDPDLVRAVEDNFDDLIQWGREKYSA